MLRRPLPLAVPLFVLTAVAPLAAAQSDSTPQTADGTPAGVKAPLVSVERLRADLRWLTSFPTRHTLSAQNVEVARALREKFRAMGYEDVALEEFSVRRTTRFNVVATKRGETRPEEIVVLGAHFDSRNKDDADARGPAPGADDNASGTSAVLEIARQLANVPTARTVRFVLFSGEEQGLVGATAHAEALKAAGANVVLMANLDMIGHSSPPGPNGDAPPPTFPERTAAPDAAGARRSIYVESDQGLNSPDNDAASKRWGDRLEQIVYGYGLGVSRGPLYGTDYLPFETAGYPAVGLYDGADTEPFYHNADDLPAVVDADYHARAASATLELIKLAAGTPDAP
ncbi:M28 family metallopeptidase [Alienimonas sp. DA493]|uniref:M28 family metallopeptidase n=1 Tax=Alienimonas sp. DA493 TaxID=3373605 RepID=UPI0037540E5F